MEIEVGEYVRTNKGNIIKMTSEGFIKILLEGKSVFGKPLKHSKNIIDLIEVGDYVNEKLIEEIANIQGKTCLFYDLELPMEVGLHFYTEQDIKVIVTHEQFEDIEYKVETEDK